MNAMRTVDGFTKLKNKIKETQQRNREEERTEPTHIENILKSAT
jgi:cell division protein ZapA (FtsZ GTPase activity inhibitor)